VLWCEKVTRLPAWISQSCSVATRRNAVLCCVSQARMTSAQCSRFESADVLDLYAVRLQTIDRAAASALMTHCDRVGPSRGAKLVCSGSALRCFAPSRTKRHIVVGGLGNSSAAQSDWCESEGAESESLGQSVLSSTARASEH
jgi:hypothetical protein